MPGLGRQRGGAGGESDIARSILTRGQRRLFLILLVLGVVMLATSAFLFTTHPADESLPAFYQVVLLTHIVGGLLILLPMVAFVLWHLRRALRMKNRAAIASGASLAVVGLVLAATGLTVITQANSLAYRWVFRTHQIGAIVLLVLFVTHRLLSRNRPGVRRIATGLASALVLYGALVGGLTATRSESGEYSRVASVPPVGPAASGRRDPFVPFRPPNAVPQDSPFFPSAATTTSGGFLATRVITREEVEGRETVEEDMRTFGFAVGQKLGAETCDRCHPDIVEQWSVSAHRFSSLNNPFYLAPIEELRERHGNERSQWCAGCHDPAILFPGNMMKEFDRGSPEAQAGLTCLACHAIDRIHNVTGNGNYNLSDERPSPYLFDGSDSALGRYLFDRLIKAKPDVHKRRMLKPFFREEEYCATCHKVSIDVPVNDYRFLRGQDEYDEHQASGVTRVNPRTFYLPEKARS
ncbi:MAG: multiheme c-type cytochrome, partial [Planctomycetota bacterium]